MWQRLDDWVGIRQPVKEAEARDTGPPAYREVCRTRTVQRLTCVMSGCVTKQEPNEIYASGWCVWHWPALHKIGTCVAGARLRR